MAGKPSYEDLEQRVKDLENEVLEHERLTNMLGSSEKQLGQIIAGSPIPTFVIDSNHIVAHYNTACENLTGLSAKDIVGTDDQWKSGYPEKRPVMADIILDQASERTVAEYYFGKYKKSDVAPGAYSAQDFFPNLGEEGKWLFLTAVPIKDSRGQVVGAIETLQDITEEKRSTLQNELMLRISQALHEHHDLESLLNYITSEVKELLGTEAAVVLLLDQETRELYFIASAYEDPEIGRRVKEVRLSLDQLASAKVIETGEPLIHYEPSDGTLYPERDEKLGYVSRNLISVPLRAEGRIIGVLNAVNKIEGTFGSKDVDLLSMVAGTVALSIENARVSEELKGAYREVSSLNAAKDRTIKHLSHELKTPMQTLTLSLDILKEALKQVPKHNWKRPMELSKKSLKRIIAIQEEVADIMQDRQFKSYGLISLMFEQCSDVLAGLFAGECGDGRLFENVKDRIEEAFGLRRAEPEKIRLDEFIQARIETSQKRFDHRRIDVDCILDPDLFLFLPKDMLGKVVDGLIRNAVENTPDEGKIKIRADREGDRIEFSVHDFGIGIAEEHSEKIFQGYLPTQDLMRYSTKSPYDFYAGGKGADLLRMKIFSEKYHFNISMESQYCPHIEQSQGGVCPGVISKCSACEKREDCLSCSGTCFTLSFQESKAL